jgi:uncharacterized protein with FMN-binding domain
MRKTVTTLAVAAVLFVPFGNAWAGLHTPKATPKKIVSQTITVTGPRAPCGPNNKWGDLQARIKVKKTTTTVGARKSVKLKILAIDFPVKSDHTFKTVYITNQALPVLSEDVLSLQTANVENISGATDTVVSFKKTLGAALLQAKK